MKREARFTTEFVKWAKLFKKESFAAEIKVTTGKSLPFNAIKDHQSTALYHVKHGKLVYKIPDEGISQKPFDVFSLHGTSAYVVVYFDKPGNKQFFMVEVDDWMNMEKESPRKSITEEGLQTIGTVCTL